MSRARDFADLASAYSGGALANRNLIVNGAFQVDQKSETATKTGSGHAPAETGSQESRARLERWQGGPALAGGEAPSWQLKGIRALI